MAACLELSEADLTRIHQRMREIGASVNDS